VDRVGARRPVGQQGADGNRRDPGPVRSAKRPGVEVERGNRFGAQPGQQLGEHQRGDRLARTDRVGLADVREELVARAMVPDAPRTSPASNIARAFSDSASCCQAYCAVRNSEPSVVGLAMCIRSATACSSRPRRAPGPGRGTPYRGRTAPRTLVRVTAPPSRPWQPTCRPGRADGGHARRAGSPARCRRCPRQPHDQADDQRQPRVPVRTVPRFVGDWLGGIWVEGQVAELGKRGNT
jgi:hypothetical protein